MSKLAVRLLGELALSRDGAPVPLPQSRKTRALLAYLILKPGPERRERLCEIFWQMPDDPRGALRWSLSKLRGLVNGDGVERLRADRERVEFVPGEHTEVDVLELRGRVTGGIDALGVEELAGIAQALAGELLAGLDLPDQEDFHYFLARERQQLRDRRAEVLRALAGRCASAPAAAVEWLRALVETDPHDVESHRRLIEALAGAGRRKEAERQKAVSLAQLGDLAVAERIALQRAVHVRPVAAEQGSQPSLVPAGQQIRFCQTVDGVQIAYATVGEGPPLVKTANWLNHLEFDWESPVWRHVFRDLGAGRRLIRYDARGNGLSDWDTDDYSFQSMVSDLEAVVDACGLERFPLLGISQGCAVSVEYAVRHPERVSHLVLYGGYARGWNRVSSSALARQAEAMLTLVGMGWGKDNPVFRQMWTSLFMPDAPEENRLWFNDLQRLTSSPENAVRLIRACGEVDVQGRLGDVRCPTLVLHARDDAMTSFNAGRGLAAGIPGARFVSLDSANHLLPETDPAWPRMLSEIRAFLAEADC